MKKEIDLITIGYHKGELDFGVNCSIEELSFEQMEDLRAIICVAIGRAENMWRKGHEIPCGEQEKNN